MYCKWSITHWAVRSGGWMMKWRWRGGWRGLGGRKTASQPSVLLYCEAQSANTTSIIIIIMVIMVMYVVRGAPVCVHRPALFDNTLTGWQRHTHTHTPTNSAVVSLPVGAEGDNLITSSGHSEVISTQCISDCGTPPTSQHWPGLLLAVGEAEQERSLSEKDLCLC